METERGPASVYGRSKLGRRMRWARNIVKKFTLLTIEQARGKDQVFYQRYLRAKALLAYDKIQKS